MAVVTYSPGIQYAKGSFAKPKKQDGHKHGDYLIGTHREAATTNPNCTRMYIRKAETYVRSTDPSAKELLIRARFNAVSKAVALRRKDLMQINQDNAAFLAQRDTAGGCKTLTKYLWKVCGDEYDEQHGA